MVYLKVSQTVAGECMEQYQNDELDIKTDIKINAKINAKINIEELLAQGTTIQMKPQGYSMYPMFVPSRDEAVIAPVDVSTLRRGDVVLYRRDQVQGGILVLHRIYRRQGDAFYMVGDNQSEIEGPLRADQIRGKLIAWIRNGKRRSVKHPGYRMFFGMWLWMLPLRAPIHKMLAVLRGNTHKGETA